MYAKDYTSESLEQATKRNHRRKLALFSKIAAKLQGRAGRWRGKNGRQENNKARGGKFAR